ncbi:hypothetical protein NQ317_006033 [Molorchus minor]|uniref:Uncharacterized protein n=1 Tax=Molorchus minor TaxID=1323400 RepID=A0ABQ9K1S2_9CUCU|nr:hypothetical protein NQ317_006033 [Molorchus minor]
MKGSPDYSKEIKINVPWGHIAAKAWGDEKDKIILVFHGILDNAGVIRSPDTPLTKNRFTIYVSTYLVMGTIHSYRPQLWWPNRFLFSLLYPHFVEKLIMLDTITLYPVTTDYYKPYLSEKFDWHYNMEKKFAASQEPTYTLKEDTKRKTYSTLTKEAAITLAKRSIAAAEDGKYRLTIDQRLKNFINPLSDFRYIIEVIKMNRVTIPILMVLGSDSSIQQQYLQPILRVFREWNNVTIEIIPDGNHDVHNELPERVAPCVSKFLLNKKGSIPHQLMAQPVS